MKALKTYIGTATILASIFVLVLFANSLNTKVNSLRTDISVLIALSQTKELAKN